MYSRLLKRPLEENQCFFLFGARGVGKSYWISSNLKNALVLDLLESEVSFDLEANPQRLEKLISEHHKGWVVIDEIQKVPALLDEVHRLIEKKRIKFILTGSSARKLKRKGANLLAGRALTYKMYPLTVEELGKDFSLKKSLLYGHLPKIYDEPKLNPEKYLKSYISTYLKEEVKQEGFSRNLGAFSRFLEAASFSQGSILNTSAVAREAGIKQKTVEGYFDLIEDMLLSYKIPVFTKRAKRRLVSHPKFYFFDVGIYQSLRPKGMLDRKEEIEGIALESLVLQELIALNEYYELDYQIYYWRTSHGVEVDFILYGPKGLIAIEVKRGGKIHPSDLNGLKSFANDYPGATLMLFYSGNKEEFHEKIKVIPITEALKNLKKLIS